MPKPWELDWSAGAPAPDAIPLPIVPFFGRQRPPMLGEAAPAIDPAAAPLMGPYGMVAADPSATLAAASSPMLAGDPSAIFSAAPSAMPTGAPPAMSSAAALALAAADRLAQASGSSAASATDPSAGLQHALLQAAPASGPFFDAAGAGHQPLLQPTVDTSWNGLGTFGPSSPALAPRDSASVAPMLAAQQTLQTYGYPGGTQPWQQRGGSRPPTRNSAGAATPSVIGGQVARSSLAAAMHPPGPAGAPAQNPLYAEWGFQDTINKIMANPKVPPDQKVLRIQQYAANHGRPIDPHALAWLKGNPASGQQIGSKKPGEIISLAQRGVRLRNRLVREGFSPPAAAALAGNAMAESFGYYGSPQLSGGDGYGLWQWNTARRAEFEKQFGKKFSDAKEDDQIRFMIWEMQHQRMFQSSWATLHSNQSAGAMARSVALDYERMADKNGAPEARAAIAELLNSIPVDPRMNLAPPSSPPPEVEAFLRRQAAKARSMRR